MLTYIFCVLLPSFHVIIYAAHGYLCIDTPCCEVKLQILVYMADGQRLLMNEEPYPNTECCTNCRLGHRNQVCIQGLAGFHFHKFREHNLSSSGVKSQQPKIMCVYLHWIPKRKAMFFRKCFCGRFHVN